MLKVLSLFSGIGAFEKALENIDEPFELINYCEIDKYASKAFSLIHGVNERLNLGDITAINTAALPNDIDVVTYGFPCQDISNAGKQAGFTDKNGDMTRSGLFFEALRIIEDTKPKFAIAENVKALTGKKFTAEFKIVLDSLNDAGYKNYWAVLNAKDYGIPQNRERVFIISIRDDIDHGFDFPKPYESKLRLKDLLETDVDEKYYLTDEQIESFIRLTAKAKAAGNGFKFAPTDGNGVAKTITTRAGTRTDDNSIIEPKVLQIGNIVDDTNIGFKNPQRGRIYDPDGISPTLNCMQGGGLEPKIAIKDVTKKGYAEVGNGVIEPPLRIRKLTPKECFRLMGFDDEDCDILVDNGISNTQLYKMAGNSIVVDVLEEIYVKLLNQYSKEVEPRELICTNCGAFM